MVVNRRLSGPESARLDRWFNTDAFAINAVGTFGNLGRNALRGQKFWNLDTSLVRDFPFGERRRLQFRADMFNIANHPQYAQPILDLNNSAFGSINNTLFESERQIQFGAKLYF